MNDKQISKETANAYVREANCTASTRKKKYLTLQLLLKTLVDPNIALDKVRARISYMPKYVLKNTEISRYLAEQQSVNYEDYIIQRLRITYGLRINTIASLRLKHLEFL